MSNDSTNRGPGRPPLPETERRSTRIYVRLSDEERAELDVCAERWGRSSSELVRSVPALLRRYDGLVRAALRPRVGELAPHDIKAILDVSNGRMLLLELEDDGVALGSRGLCVELEDADEINGLGEKWDIPPARMRTLVERLAGWTVGERAALEVWAADLWERCDDEALWEREVAWLAGS